MGHPVALRGLTTVLTSPNKQKMTAHDKDDSKRWIAKMTAPSTSDQTDAQLDAEAVSYIQSVKPKCLCDGQCVCKYMYDDAGRFRFREHCRCNLQCGCRPRDCQWGEKCTRKNPNHWATYVHPQMTTGVEGLGVADRFIFASINQCLTRTQQTEGTSNLQ